MEFFHDMFQTARQLLQLQTIGKTTKSVEIQGEILYQRIYSALNSLPWIKFDIAHMFGIQWQIQTFLRYRNSNISC